MLELRFFREDKSKQRKGCRASGSPFLLRVKRVSLVVLGTVLCYTYL